MMTRSEAEQLIAKYIDGNCSSEEKQLVDTYFLKYLDGKTKLPSQFDIETASREMRGAIEAEIGSFSASRATRLWSRIAAAAAVLLVVGLGLLFYSRYTNTLRHLEGSAATRDLVNDIKPGGNKAYLVLSNGKRVSLTDAANGELAKEAGVEITKTADGQVIYTAKAPLSPQGGSLPEGARGSDGASSDGVKYSNALNTIETPRGGQYQIRLPDGSKVWLNAASKLIYPVSFNGRGQRVVELSGEAYFEIFKNKLQPFVVKSKNQEVTVLGTHFNINSYADEPGTKTTLLEGSVQVSTLQPLALSGRDAHGAERVNGSAGNSNSSLPARGISPRGGERFGLVLKPNEQSVLVNGKIVVKQVDPALAVDWKNGQFIFESEPLPSILRRVARWYNVTIIYTSTDKNNTTFSGVVSRADNVSSVLRMLQKTSKIKFTIDGNTVKVE
ncbi:FecR family protein [Pedobacter nutrimenti]|uniref:FecR family protein n=1 Tax=Pedobacter nutrimenti TaxID=1241337 RepID=UPI00292FD135|nr:FecR domain-containing protein [Pedobacter nutrimenti]